MTHPEVEVNRSCPALAAEPTVTGSRSRRRLSKRYGATRTLQGGVSLSLRQGQVRASARANGTDKSAVIRMLTGVERPDSGERLRDDVFQHSGSRDGASKVPAFSGLLDQSFADRSPVCRQASLGLEERPSCSSRRLLLWDNVTRGVDVGPKRGHMHD